MKTPFIIKPDPKGLWLSKQGQRVAAPEAFVNGPGPFRGFSARFHMVLANDTEDAVKAFGLRPAPPLPVCSASKLTIKRKLEAMGKWEVFKAVMLSMPATVQDEWALAQEIREDDPLFLANRDALVAALGITPEQLDGLFAD